MNIDPITLAVVRGGLEEITNEMDLVFMRTAFSPVISEGEDRASGIYHPKTGEVIAQGERGLPMFVSVMQFAVQAVINSGKPVADGDIYLLNDPYLGGTHLMDVKMVMPLFYKGELFAYLGNTGHWPDVGGSVPGGYSTTATEVYQEGIRMPPIRLYRGGQLNDDLLDLLLLNIRIPTLRLGDIRSQVAALRAGAAQYRALIDKYGREVIEQCIIELKCRSETQMRAYIDQIPEGTYSFEDYMDNDGIDDTPLKIALDLTVVGSDMTLDFSRSSPPCRGPLNGVLSATMAACHVAVKHIFPDVPINSGCFEPLHFIIPETTFLNARPPRPVSGCAAEVSQRIIDVVFGALAQALPEKVPAAAFSTVNNLAIAGEDPLKGDYVTYMYGGGGYGGGLGFDGLTNGASTVSNARTAPIEIYEQRAPILFTRWALRENSAGPGEFRGGFGVVREFELLRGEALASFLGERSRFAPFGLHGGRAAERTILRFHKDGEVIVPPRGAKADRVPLKAGDRVEIQTPGGGGYCNPFKRAPRLVLRDVRRGYYSRETARVAYGVEITDGGELDLEATRKLRDTARRAHMARTSTAQPS